MPKTLRLASGERLPGDRLDVNQREEGREAGAAPEECFCYVGCRTGARRYCHLGISIDSHSVSNSMHFRRVTLGNVCVPQTSMRPACSARSQKWRTARCSSARLRPVASMSGANGHGWVATMGYRTARDRTLMTAHRRASTRGAVLNLCARETLEHIRRHRSFCLRRLLVHDSQAGPHLVRRPAPAQAAPSCPAGNPRSPHRHAPSVPARLAGRLAA